MKSLEVIDRIYGSAALHDKKRGPRGAEYWRAINARRKERSA